MLRQFALLGMGVAILPSYLIGRDLASGRLVPLLGDYRLPQVEITIAYPSRLHLPAKVRTFIDHLVAHFQRADDHASDPRARMPRRAVAGSPAYAADMPVSALPGDTARAKPHASRSRIVVASSPL
jgi:hypothetical protein